MGGVRWGRNKTKYSRAWHWLPAKGKERNAGSGSVCLKASWQAWLPDYKTFPLVSACYFPWDSCPVFLLRIADMPAAVWSGSGWFSIGNLGATAAVWHPQSTYTAWVCRETGHGMLWSLNLHYTPAYRQLGGRHEKLEAHSMSQKKRPCLNTVEGRSQRLTTEVVLGLPPFKAFWVSDLWTKDDSQLEFVSSHSKFEKFWNLKRLQSQVFWIKDTPKKKHTKK